MVAFWLVIAVLCAVLLLLIAPVIETVALSLWLTLSPSPLQSPVWLILAAIFSVPLIPMAVLFREACRGRDLSAKPRGLSGSTLAIIPSPNQTMAWLFVGFCFTGNILEIYWQSGRFCGAPVRRGKRTGVSLSFRRRMMR